VSYILIPAKVSHMTIRLRRNTASRIDNEQIAALITQSILSPSNDDAPGAAKPKPQGSWISWSGGLSKSTSNDID